MQRYLGAIFIICIFIFSATILFAAELKFATQEFAPYSFTVNGVARGAATEIVRETCKEMKIICTFKSLPWKRAQNYTKAGKMQGIFVIAHDQQRSKWLSFTMPIINAEYGFFMRSDKPFEYQQPSSVSGYKVGVYGPSNTANALEKLNYDLNSIEIDMTPHDEAAFKKLSVGRVDFVYSNKDVGVALIKKNRLNNIKYAGYPREVKYHIAFSTEFTDVTLVKQFNDTLQLLSKQGVIKNILKEYALQDVVVEE